MSFSFLRIITMEILYETLSPLAGETSTPPPPPSSSPEIEPYVVLRNHISLSTIQCPSPESAAPDYFSLDVNEAEDNGTLISATPPPSRDAAPSPDRKFEGSWFHSNSRFRSPMLRLHKEILDFCDFLSPTAEEQESRNAAIKSVFDVINYIWPNAVAEVFGSFETGLYLPSSDIDVVILGSNVRTPQIGLQALSRALSQRGIAKKMQVIARARVPIIKFVEKKSGFAFDISFDVHNGPKAAEFIKDAVSKWPPLKPLCLILKVFLQQRELNEVYTGGIGSYALLSMLIAMLRTQRDNQTSPECNLGFLLVNFFDMYGCKLNTVDVGVSCNGKGTFFQKDIKGFSVEGRPSLIAIEDPQAPDNDIGKSSFNYYQAKSAFAMAFSTLTNTKTIARLGPNKSILSAIIRPDAVLLERKGGSDGKLTFNNLFPNNGEPLDRLHGDQQEIYCNWALNDEEEEPLPRGGGGTPGDSDVKSSGKKRKASKEKRSSKKVKGHVSVDRREKEHSEKRWGPKRRWRHLQSSG
ncbi:terminal nucleotidyltransferase 4B-like isoform X2 [Salvia hispanica]|uniref:terminal nucleotidyltransferase 4B-like isoform X2 n=1 Tax=Salvia hispanica TaxID=49212 RepID=UPI002009B0A0|nr:terminal nucleotidyltransferase 4B-like isoform X2 [Salvia hispanica]